MHKSTVDKHGNVSDIIKSYLYSMINFKYLLISKVVNHW